MPPDLALWLTLISSNHPCLEHIFVVPKAFEPLKFYCIIIFRANKTAYSIIAREQAPSGATADMFVPENVSSTIGKHRKK